MRHKMATCAAALAMLTGAGSVGAHHSGNAYERTAIWIQGEVVGFEPVNPHTIITLEARREDGQVRRWAVEGPPQTALERRSDATRVPKIGDTLEFCAFPYKSVAELSRIWPDVDFSASRSAQAADGSSPQFVAGHVMVMPDGAKQFWEPHGLISECVRTSDDDRQTWLAFIDSNAGARQAWCEQERYAYVESNAVLNELVNEINASLAEPCQ